ncbi:MAG: tRNA lysidine(34) synthetase TilS [Treponema sp.]|jgi:tRNA(Ile)-lysidine synthase|nr:tRNA lysidine(34) synthetase TilS [Treponema sp.]
MRLVDIVADAILNCPAGTTYLAAVSGGADSVAMLSALASVRERNAVFDLRCIHVEHGIRSQDESRGDAEFVKDLCKKLNVPCKIVSIKPGRIAAVAKERGIGIEAAARLFRHRVWLREAKRLEISPEKPQVRVLVAHTADDALETTLMRIFRGAGPSGLAPMPADRGRIIRPLIKLHRSDVIAYLTEKKIPWREDSSNSDIRFLRNHIRHRLIPSLNESFPNWRTALGAFTETQSLAADFIQNEASNRISWRPLEPQPSPQPSARERRKGSPLEDSQGPALYTDAGLFFTQPEIIREEALFQGIDALLSLARVSTPSRTVKRKNIRRFSEGAITAADLGPVRIRKNSQQIILSPVPKATLLPPQSLVPFPHENGFSLLINKLGLYTLKDTAIEVCEIPADGNEGEGAFFALLPLVLRPGFKEDTVLPKGTPLGTCPGKIPGKFTAAVDALGTAACIAQGRLAWSRDSSAVAAAVAATAVQAAAQMSSNGRICMVRIGGTDVR